MDDLEDFEQKRRDFEIWRKDNKSYFVKLEDLRKQFLRRFPQDKLSDLDIDQYVEGKGNKDSFCNWLENRLVELGSMSGANAFKFGIYYGRTKKDPTVTYRFAARFGSSPEAAFDRVKQEIVALLSVGKAKNIDAIQNNMHYFNRARPHQGIQQQIPEQKAGSVPPHHESGKVIAFPVLGGLHRDYRRSA
jgi:hypothetical protein